MFLPTAIQYAESYAAGAGLDVATRAAFLQQNAALLNPAQVAVLLGHVNGANAAGIVQQAIAGRSFKDALDVRVQALGYFNIAKDKASLLATARDHVSAYPATFNAAYLQTNVFGSPLMEAPEKLALLGEFAAAVDFAKSRGRINKEDPVAGVRELIQAQVQATPDRVGPPINILRIAAAGYTWAEEGHVCATRLP